MFIHKVQTKGFYKDIFSYLIDECKMCSDDILYLSCEDIDDQFIHYTSIESFIKDYHTLMNDSYYKDSHNCLYNEGIYFKNIEEIVMDYLKDNTSIIKFEYNNIIFVRF